MTDAQFADAVRRNTLNIRPAAVSPNADVRFQGVAVGHFIFDPDAGVFHVADGFDNEVAHAVTPADLPQALLTAFGGQFTDAGMITVMSRALDWNETR